MEWKRRADQGYPDLIDNNSVGGEGGELEGEEDCGDLQVEGEGGDDHGGEGGLREGGRAPGVRRMWQEDP